MNKQLLSLEDQANQAMEEAAAAQVKAQELAAKAKALADERERTRQANQGRYSEWLVKHFEEHRQGAAAKVNRLRQEFDQAVPQAGFNDLPALVQKYQALRLAVIEEVEVYMRFGNALAFLGQSTYQDAGVPGAPTRNLGTFTEMLDKALALAERPVVADIRDQTHRQIEDAKDGRFPPEMNQTAD